MESKPDVIVGESSVRSMEAKSAVIVGESSVRSMESKPALIVGKSSVRSMECKPAVIVEQSAACDSGAQSLAQSMANKTSCDTEQDMAALIETESKCHDELRKKRREKYASNLVYRPRKAAINVLTRMEDDISGPMTLLQRAAREKLRVRVWTRSAVHVRGICTGFIVVFDKHWNLAMTDVDEVYQSPRQKLTTYSNVTIQPPPQMQSDVCDKARNPPASRTGVSSSEVSGDHTASVVKMQVDGANDDLLASPEPGSGLLGKLHLTVREGYGSEGGCDENNKTLIGDIELSQVDGSGDQLSGGGGQSSGPSTDGKKLIQTASSCQKDSRQGEIPSDSEEELDYEDFDTDSEVEYEDSDVESDNPAMSEEENEGEENEEELIQRLKLLQKELSLLDEVSDVEDQPVELSDESSMKPRDRREQRHRASHSPIQGRNRRLGSSSHSVQSLHQERRRHHESPDRGSRMDDRSGSHHSKQRDKDGEKPSSRKQELSGLGKKERKSVHCRLYSDSSRRGQISEHGHKNPSDLREVLKRSRDLKKMEDDKLTEHHHKRGSDGDHARRGYRDRYKVEEKSKWPRDSGGRDGNYHSRRTHDESRSERREEVGRNRYEHDGSSCASLGTARDRGHRSHVSSRDVRVVRESSHCHPHSQGHTGRQEAAESRPRHSGLVSEQIRAEKCRASKKKGISKNISETVKQNTFDLTAVDIPSHSVDDKILSDDSGEVPLSVTDVDSEPCHLRKKLICRRHLRQLFIRGDNVVMVALADE